MAEHLSDHVTEVVSPLFIFYLSVKLTAFVANTHLIGRYNIYTLSDHVTEVLILNYSFQKYLFTQFAVYSTYNNTSSLYSTLTRHPHIFGHIQYPCQPSLQLCPHWPSLQQYPHWPL